MTKINALALATLLAFIAPAWAQQPIDEGFEGALPDFHLYQATCAADAARAHSGKSSLRVTPAKDFGGAYFKLDGTLDFASDYEFTLWAYAGSNCTVNAYISASGGKERYRHDHWAKRHPLFEGLPTGGPLDYTFYRNVISDVRWAELDVPDELAAASIDTSFEYDSGLLLGVYSLGADEGVGLLSASHPLKNAARRSFDNG